jgi:hypothetical protein
MIALSPVMAWVVGFEKLSVDTSSMDCNALEAVYSTITTLISNLSGLVGHSDSDDLLVNNVIDENINLENAIEGLYESALSFATSSHFDIFDNMVAIHFDEGDGDNDPFDMVDVSPLLKSLIGKFCMNHFSL